VEERLFLDRVTLHAGYITPGDVELAAAVEPHLANSGLALGNGALVAAGVTTDTVPFNGLPEVADPGVGGEDFGEGGHDTPPTLSIPRGG
jgi:hypothetical protein